MEFFGKRVLEILLDDFWKKYLKVLTMSDPNPIHMELLVLAQNVQYLVIQRLCTYKRKYRDFALDFLHCCVEKKTYLKFPVGMMVMPMSIPMTCATSQTTVMRTPT